MHSHMGDVRMGSEAHRHDVTSYASVFRDVAVQGLRHEAQMQPTVRTLDSFQHGVASTHPIAGSESSLPITASTHRNPGLAQDIPVAEGSEDSDTPSSNFSDEEWFDDKVPKPEWREFYRPRPPVPTSFSNPTSTKEHEKDLRKAKRKAVAKARDKYHTAQKKNYAKKQKIEAVNQQRADQAAHVAGNETNIRQQLELSQQRLMDPSASSRGQDVN